MESKELRGLAGALTAARRAAVAALEVRSACATRACAGRERARNGNGGQNGNDSSPSKPSHKRKQHTSYNTNYIACSSQEVLRSFAA